MEQEVFNGRTYSSEPSFCGYLDYDNQGRQIEVTRNGSWVVATGEKIAFGSHVVVGNKSDLYKYSAQQHEKAAGSYSHEAMKAHKQGDNKLAKQLMDEKLHQLQLGMQDRITSRYLS
ncbi:MAG: hypothetical protein QNJ55_28915 [Xenococcus sp. MO_188.B8]|nr:hypothetical protein [Xenococcus sp. MO_188.B8]